MNVTSKCSGMLCTTKDEILPGLACVEIMLAYKGILLQTVENGKWNSYLFGTVMENISTILYFLLTVRGSIDR